VLEVELSIVTPVIQNVMVNLSEAGEREIEVESHARVERGGEKRQQDFIQSQQKFEGVCL
jgi:hypothetical protein